MREVSLVIVGRHFSAAIGVKPEAAATQRGGSTKATHRRAGQLERGAISRRGNTAEPIKIAAVEALQRY